MTLNEVGIFELEFDSTLFIFLAVLSILSQASSPYFFSMFCLHFL
ncbi:hypothetical protein VP96_03777 [Vibrio cholerae]|nr:hypothetical protein VP96_03777 [Vibrio cholerae]